MTSAVPPSDQMRASGSGRRKVALPPGRSQLDWVRNSASLRPPTPRSISMGELRLHKKKQDAWVAVNGHVYDVTPYIEYHPGGAAMILSGAGKDATGLFNKYHSWVNPAFMLKNCYLGMIDGPDDDVDGDGDDDDDDDDDDDGYDDDDDDDGKDEEDASLPTAITGTP